MLRRGGHTIETHQPTIVADRELRITRRIPAPPQAVLPAWTDAEQVKRWFGPYGMAMPEAELDLCPGGFHRTLMRDAKGKEYVNCTQTDEVVAPHRLVVRIADKSCGPEDGRTLHLEAEEPSFTGKGTSRYLDSATMTDDHTREVTSAVQEADGSWQPFMSGRFTQIG